MRRRKLSDRNEVFKVVKELDAFPKVPESYVETSASGGGISVITFILMFILTVSEVIYHAETHLQFEYAVDTDHSGKLKLNIDMTIAMRCRAIGADVLDLTGQNVFSFGQLNEEETYFKLSPRQQKYYDNLHSMNEYMRQEYHAIQDLLWKKGGYSGVVGQMPKREDSPDRPFDACRVYGTLDVNKVAGNYHITAGKSIPVIPSGHAHLSMMVDNSEYNFSHRIDHISFGEQIPGIINPLDGDMLISHDNYHMFQYFIQVVPTSVNTRKIKLDTYQYSVTERNRTVDHSKGSHGLPGIFVKYDLSPIKVKVTEESRSTWRFIVRLCGIVGGIFTTCGIINSLVGIVVDFVCCRRADRHRIEVRQSADHVDMQSVPQAVPTVSLVAQPVDTNLPTSYQTLHVDDISLQNSVPS